MAIQDNVELIKLRDFVFQKFSPGEFDKLCYDNFKEFYDKHEGSREDKETLARWLITYCVNRDVISDLHFALLKERPGPYEKVFGEKPPLTTNTVLRDVKQVSSQDIKEMSDLQKFSHLLVTTQWLANTDLALSLKRELDHLAKAPGYRANTLELLFQFSQTMDDRKFRSQLVNMKYNIDEIFYARQAVLCINNQVWDKGKRISIDYKRKLRDVMLEAFGRLDLDSICFDLFGRTDIVEGRTIRAWIQNLIGYCEQLSNVTIYELIARCYWERPDKDWDWNKGLTSDDD